MNSWFVWIITIFNCELILTTKNNRFMRGGALQLFTTVIGLLFHSIGYGQMGLIDIQMGPIFERTESANVFICYQVNDTSIQVVTGSDEHGIDTKLYFVKYGQNLSAKTEKIYSQEVEGYSMAYGKPFYFGGALYLFGATIQKKEEIVKSYLQQIDVKSLSYIGDPRQIHVAVDATILEMPYLDYAVSDDGNYLGVINIPKYLANVTEYPGLGFNYVGNDLEQPSGEYTLYEPGLNNELVTKFVLPYAEDLCEIKSVMLANNGDLLLLARVYYNSHKPMKGGKPNSIFVVMQIKAGSGKVISYDIALQDRFMVDADMRPDEQGGITCTGIWGDRGPGLSAGMFSARIDVESELMEPLIHAEFKTKLFEFYSETLPSEAHRINRSIYFAENFETKEVFYLGDGSLLHISEIYSYGNGVSVHGDILVLKISPNSTIESMIIIRKFQDYWAEKGAGFFAQEHNDVVKVLYYGNREDMEQAGAEGEYKYDKVPMIATVQRDGTVTKQVVTNLKKDDNIILENSEQLKDGRSILVLKDGNFWNIGLMSVE